MSYSITLSKAADADIRAIYEYIAYDLHSPQTAAALINRLEKEIFSLDEMPERYCVYNAEPWRSRNLRIMPVDHYLVFYIPDRVKQTVSIIRVMHGSRDTATQLDPCVD